MNEFSISLKRRKRSIILDKFTVTRVQKEFTGPAHMNVSSPKVVEGGILFRKGVNGSLIGHALRSPLHAHLRTLEQSQVVGFQKITEYLPPPHLPLPSSSRPSPLPPTHTCLRAVSGKLLVCNLRANAGVLRRGESAI